LELVELVPAGKNAKQVGRRLFAGGPSSLPLAAGLAGYRRENSPSASRFVPATQKFRFGNIETECRRFGLVESTKGLVLILSCLILHEKEPTGHEKDLNAPKAHHYVSVTRRLYP
jgi:hypothetical protein